MATKRKTGGIKKRSKKTTSKIPHRKKTEWLPVKYFILEEILKKGSVKTDDLRKSVNLQLASLKTQEPEVKKQKFTELLKEVQEQVPGLKLKNGYVVDTSEIAIALLKDLPKDQDTSDYLERIVRATNDHSLQIMKLLWRFNAGLHVDIYNKLRKFEENPSEKRILVDKVCKLLKKKKIHKVMLSTGVTMFELGRQIIQGHDELGIQSIISSNMLIHVEFLLSKIPLAQLLLEMPTGKMFFRQETASFGQERELSLEELNSEIMEDIQASILSFTSLSFNEGFKIGLDYSADINEKLIHLRPPTGCSLVIITIDWDKILSDAPGTTVKDAQGRKSYRLFDFSNDRKYIIITNRPKDISSEIDQKRADDLKKWEDEGKATVIDTEEKLHEYTKNKRQRLNSISMNSV